jgi:hypothetical protein
MEDASSRAWKAFALEAETLLAEPSSAPPAPGELCLGQVDFKCFQVQVLVRHSSVFAADVGLFITTWLVAPMEGHGDGQASHPLRLGDGRGVGRTFECASLTPALGTSAAGRLILVSGARCWFGRFVPTLACSCKLACKCASGLRLGSGDTGPWSLHERQEVWKTPFGRAATWSHTRQERHWLIGGQKPRNRTLPHARRTRNSLSNC